MANIHRFAALRAEYVMARDNAMRLLTDIAFPKSLRSRKTVRVAGRDYDETTDNYPRGVGIPRTVSWEAEIAQLAALKRVSQDALHEFMTEVFVFIAW